jgi:hypothetical protein
MFFKGRLYFLNSGILTLIINMRDHKITLVEDIRKLLSGYKSHEFTFQNLANELNLSADTLVNAFGTEAGLV